MATLAVIAFLVAFFCAATILTPLATGFGIWLFIKFIEWKENRWDH